MVVTEVRTTSICCGPAKSAIDEAIGCWSRNCKTFSVSLAVHSTASPWKLFLACATISHGQRPLITIVPAHSCGLEMGLHRDGLPWLGASDLLLVLPRS